MIDELGHGPTGYAGVQMIEIHGESYLSSKEASEILGIKPSTLYAYVSRGLLRSYRQGMKRQRLYRQRDLVEALAVRPSRERPGLPEAADWVGDH